MWEPVAHNAVGRHGKAGVPAVPHVEGGPGTGPDPCAAGLMCPALMCVPRNVAVTVMIPTSLRAVIRSAIMEELSVAAIANVHLHIMTVVAVPVSNF